MMVYADYGYYASEYLGTMDENDFERLSVQASGYIDAVTFGRAAVICEGDARFDKIRRCCCALSDALFSCENGGDVTSENNDGWKITHSVYANNAVTPAQRLYSTALLWLGGTGLMSRSGTSFAPWLRV